MVTVVRTAEEVRALGRGTAFSIRLPKSMDWKDRHGVLYATANREVHLTMKGGEKIVGVLDESPGYFSQGTKAGPKVWLRIKGRKTRKGIDARDIRHLKGYRAPTLAEALGAFIILNANGSTPDQVAEARSVAAHM